MRLKLDKRTGPLYWCTYEKQFTENTFRRTVQRKY